MELFRANSVKEKDMESATNGARESELVGAMVVDKSKPLDGRWRLQLLLLTLSGSITSCL